ncbi:hypothetical protein BU15DRAFT_69617 [Melanogaster broomeanus]|nr:hypothetical protein BU15DRAFT_69617 [Melanogaster broomeanus]
MDVLALKYLKTYQVWHHRRLLVQQTKDPGTELEFVAKALRTDTKNYHTCDALWSRQLEFVESTLEHDLRNNSRWHHGFFMVFRSVLGRGTGTGMQSRRESTFVKAKLAIAPNNASAWNYLRDVVDLESPLPSSGAKLPCVAAVEFMADVYKSNGRDDTVKATEFEGTNVVRSLLHVKLWKSLAHEHDIMRKKSGPLS